MIKGIFDIVVVVDNFIIPHRDCLCVLSAVFFFFFSFRRVSSTRTLSFDIAFCRYERRGGKGREKEREELRAQERLGERKATGEGGKRKREV